MTVFVSHRGPDGGEACGQPRPRRPVTAAPVLCVDGFEGPLDWLLEMARAQQIDLGKLSILALVEAFVAALDAALERLRGTGADLGRWAEWLVMAATLALLRSRLLLPKDAPEARAAQDEAEALRRLLVGRVAMQRAAEWLDRRNRLGRDVFGRGGGGKAGPVNASAADPADLFRACLIALRLPDNADAFQHRRIPFWRVSEAAARITRILGGDPVTRELSAFLPPVDARAPDRELRCRAALASTLLAGLELAREGALTLEQKASWEEIEVRGGA
jgi:segregation and condensation protein A